MTDRHAGYIVTLDHDIREDDAAAIITALRMVKGVISVEPVVADHHTYVAAARVNTRCGVSGFASCTKRGSDGPVPECVASAPVRG